jgi:hypothetical protein
LECIILFVKSIIWKGLGRFEDRIKPMLEASKKLKAKYPNYGEIKMRGNGMAEFVLKKVPSRLTKTQKNIKPVKNKTRKI